MAVRARQRCLGDLERELRRRGFCLVAGADEAGRGSLFGPVYAAAVILDPDRPVEGLCDSKQLPPGERERLAGLIRERALAWAVAFVDEAVIDEINILQASRLAMRRAIEMLPQQPDCAILDAVTVDLPIPQFPLAKADERCWTVAAASILAKVARDAAMREWDRLYPGYGLARHKGYPSPEHLSALARLGPTPHHRFSYRPVREACPQEVCHLLRQRRQRSLPLAAGT
ncbi:MAG: ribonuclease HII [Bryobacterales bacterium]|nr:ribonuclease HII [Bryobacteraceae bacterium]MDW8131148.1 ribonuclease HII [Bryobacterales bacterium]